MSWKFVAGIAGVTLLSAGFFLFPRDGKTGENSNSTLARPPDRVGHERLETRSERDHRKTRTLTSDDLVAIYKTKGAAAALAAAKSLSEPERESQVAFILMYAARYDPEFAARELKDAGLDLYGQGSVVDTVMEHWEDGEKALEWATTSLTGDLLKRAVGGALRILVKTDPQAALAYLDTLPASGSRGQAICDIFVTWGHSDPGAALKYIAGNFSEDDKKSATEYTVSGWSRNHPAEAAAWVQALPDEELRTHLVADLTRNWKSIAPEEAAAWVNSLPEGTSKVAAKAVMEEVRNVVSCGFGSWQGPDVSWKTKAIEKMEGNDFWNWVSQDSEGAKKFLETSVQDKDMTQLATAVASQIAREQGAEAAFDWAKRLKGAVADEAMRAAVISWAGRDPAAAAEKLGTLDPERRAPLTKALAENWSRSDPASAAAWVATYQGAEQKPLVLEVLQQWTDSQPQEAYTWLGTLPKGAGRDEGIQYMMRREAPSDPESVIPWLDLLSEPKIREDVRLQLDGYLKNR